MPLFNHEDWVATFQNLYHLARQIRSVSFLPLQKSITYTKGDMALLIGINSVW